MPDTDPDSSVCSSNTWNLPDRTMDHLKNVMKRFRQGQHSDFTIKCGDDEYRVHKAIICARSAFFDRACSSAFKEAAEGVIDLKEDDPHAVRAMVDFFYLDNYVSSMSLNEVHRLPLAAWVEPGGDSDEEDPEDHPDEQVVPDPSPPASDTLQMHAKVFVLADKYDIKGLQYVVAKNFEQYCKYGTGFASTKDFREAIKLIYSATPPKTLLRNAIISCMIRENKCLGDQEMIDLILQTPELATELMMYLSTGNIQNVPEFKATCAVCSYSLEGKNLFDANRHSFENLSRLSCHGCTSRTWNLTTPSEPGANDGTAAGAQSAISHLDAWPFDVSG